ncbi:aryl-alcohol dehydrogenase-like predicted oxidoreductase [Antricoccus suffuscus]|uniref:Aryl-alcohol dehydrogenase-like predicted oxidoreductase n=1 Tax=Antricoccus suffuscus TaxID=1629062 RepID=A0A2T0ZY38_9ACTN|nr:aldo/keto reductase [Antricoccus suffuscus]PRZ41204.1 aryl-alcohol dehydrogenase-like predicted oxidoreductase [Antricoccus suffuscus]
MTRSPSTALPGGSALLAGHQVARIGYGAMQLERLREDPKAAIGLVRRAVEAGVSHVDTAQFYGDGFANDVLSRALHATDEVVVVTKVGADSNPGGPIPLRPAQRPGDLRASVEDNLRGLGADRLAVVNLRRLGDGPGIEADGDQVVPIEDQLATMIALRDEGKIGAIGLSGVTLDDLRTALPAGIACVQNAYNVISREHEDLLALCIAEGIAWVPFFPLGSAFARFPNVADDPVVSDAAATLGVPPVQIGLAWLLAHAPNVLLVPGTASVAHLEENLAAGDLVLPPTMIAALDG